MIAVLVASSIATSLISGIYGVGGGTILVVVMAGYLAPKIIIPIHAIVQVVSYGSTFLLGRRHLHVRIFSRFVLGAAMGAVLGRFTVLKLPDQAFALVLASAILLSTWLPPLKVGRIRGKFVTVGFFSTFLAFFVGSTGTLMSPFFLRQQLNRQQLTATKAACQLVLHLFKIVAFTTLGFRLAEHGALTLWMCLAAVTGSAAGNLFLARVPDRYFALSLRLLLTALAGKLVFSVLTLS